MWVVLGRSQGICGPSWSLLGLLWAVLGRDQVGKWPKPEREGDCQQAGKDPNRGIRGIRPNGRMDRISAKPSTNFFKRYCALFLDLLQF